jgi:hypothetical protein
VPRRARESAHSFECRTAQLAFCLSAGFLLSQNQTSIHCLGPGGRHRRLSVCSLPVPKQSEGSLGSFISVAQSVSDGTWQSARCVILVLCWEVCGLPFETSTAKSGSQPILRKLIQHIYMLIGVAKTCQTMRELRDKMAEMYGKSPVQLRLYLPTISPR